MRLDGGRPVAISFVPGEERLSAAGPEKTVVLPDGMYARVDRSPTHLFRVAGGGRLSQRDRRTTLFVLNRLSESLEHYRGYRCGFVLMYAYTPLLPCHGNISV